MSQITSKKIEAASLQMGARDLCRLAKRLGVPTADVNCRDDPSKALLVEAINAARKHRAKFARTGAKGPYSKNDSLEKLRAAAKDLDVRSDTGGYDKRTKPDLVFDINAAHDRRRALGANCRRDVSLPPVKVEVPPVKSSRSEAKYAALPQVREKELCDPARTETEELLQNTVKQEQRTRDDELAPLMDQSEAGREAARAASWRQQQYMHLRHLKGNQLRVADLRPVAQKLGVRSDVGGCDRRTKIHMRDDIVAELQRLGVRA